MVAASVKAWRLWVGPWAEVRFVAPVRLVRDDFAREHAAEFLRETRASLAEVDDVDLPDNLPGLAPAWVLQWWMSFLKLVPALVFTCLMALFGVWHLDVLVRSGVEVGRQGIQSVADMPVRLSDVNFGAQWGYWRGFVVYGLIVLILLRLFRLVHPAPDHKLGDPSADSPELEIGPASCWPVVALLASAARCGRAHRTWATGGPFAPLPRASLRTAEQVIWRAYLTRDLGPRSPLRRPGGRPHERRVLKAHAAQVIGALRVAEARQTSHPDAALRDLTSMLMTIAERYAEGRIGHLLDDDRLDPAVTVTRYVAWRVLAAMLLVACVIGAASVAGVPSEALGPLLGGSAVLAVWVFFRDRGMSPHDLIDVLRGADRR